MPITIDAAPDTAASVAFRFSAAGSPPVSSVGRRRAARSGPSVRTIDRRCWCASTSVGASSADWPPVCATASMARSATSVLPEPTSPCTRRFIGTGSARSAAISAPTVVWSPVSSNGSAASKPSSSAPPSRAVACVSRNLARCCSSAACSTNASWKRSADARLLPVRVPLRAVHEVERAAERHQPALLAHGIRHRVVDVGQGVQHHADRLRDLPAGHRRRRRVDRDRQLGPRLGARRVGALVVLEQLVVGMGELQRSAVVGDLAGEDAARAGAEVVHPPLLVEEGEHQDALAVADLRLDDRAAALAHRAVAHLEHLGHDRHVLVDLAARSAR